MRILPLKFKMPRLFSWLFKETAPGDPMHTTRGDLSRKERNHRKSRRRMQKESRRKNRGR